MFMFVLIECSHKAIFTKTKFHSIVVVYKQDQIGKRVRFNQFANIVMVAVQCIAVAL